MSSKIVRGRLFICCLVLLLSASATAQETVGLSLYLEYVAFGATEMSAEPMDDASKTMGGVIEEKTGLQIIYAKSDAPQESNALTATNKSLDDALARARAARASLLLRAVLAGAQSRQVLRVSLVDVKTERTINAQTLHVPTEGLSEAFFTNAALSAFGMGEAPELNDDVGMVPPSRVFVMEPKFSEGLVDEAGQAALTTRIGEVGTALGQEIVTTENLADLLANEKLLFALGEGDPDAFAKVAEMSKADMVLTTAFGKMGDRLAISATLIDSKDIKVINRADLTVDDTEQLLDGVESVVRGLFGFQAPLPTPRADPARFEVAMAELGQQISAAFARGDGTGVGKVAILPLAQTGEAAAAHDIGAQTATFLRTLLSSKHKIDVVDEEKTKTVAGSVDMAQLSGDNTEKLQEIGINLGAQVVVLGTVGDVGKDFLVQLRAVKVIGGKTIWSGYAVFPMGDPSSLIPADALVVRTLAGAMYASVIPGGGQFYNGLSHYWKGGVILAGTILSLGTAAVLIGIAGERYYRGLDVASGGDATLDACPISDPQERKDCGLGKKSEFDQQALIFGAAALVPLAFGGILHALGFVDAAIFVTDYSEVTGE